LLPLVGEQRFIYNCSDTTAVEYHINRRITAVIKEFTIISNSWNIHHNIPILKS